MLLLHIRACGLPPPEREARLIPERKFRWDFVWRSHKIAVEVHGGIWRGKGAHNTGTAITRDCEKANLAALAGFRTLFFTTGMVKDGTAAELLRRALCGS